jgi:hypothetical protein
MGEVMIRCPATGKAISTGMHIERARFGSMPVFFSRSYCPLCGTSHEWFARNAWICDSSALDCEPTSERQVA